MDVFVIEGVFDVTVQVPDVRTRLDGKFLFNVFCPDKFTALLPIKQTKNFNLQNVQNLQFIYMCVNSHGTVEVRFGNV